MSPDNFADAAVAVGSEVVAVRPGSSAVALPTAATFLAQRHWKVPVTY